MKMTLFDRKQQAVPAEIEVIPIAEGPRMLKVAGFAVGGLILGIGSAFIPPHLPQLILFPSAGFFFAAQFNKQRAKIGAVHSACAKCSAPMDLPGSGVVWTDDAWIRCPACSEPYRVHLED